jgi:hypothetical protein
MTLDIQWNTDNLSAGKWWGPLARLVRPDTDLGEWEWELSTKVLRLWVHKPDGHRILVSHLDQFDLPLSRGVQGPGHLAPGLVPTTQPPTFAWEVP